MDSPNGDACRCHSSHAPIRSSVYCSTHKGFPYLNGCKRFLPGSAGMLHHSSCAGSAYHRGLRGQGLQPLPEWRIATLLYQITALCVHSLPRISYPAQEDEGVKARAARFWGIWRTSSRRLERFGPFPPHFAYSQSRLAEVF